MRKFNLVPRRCVTLLPARYPLEMGMGERTYPRKGRPQ